jgi:Zn-dependent protease
VLVSGAGPAVNVLLACVGAFVAVLAKENESGKAFVEFWVTVLRFNVLLFLFNLIPIPPLDGFSVLDGAVDLGDLGRWLRQAGFLAFLIAILIVNSDAFDQVWMAASKGLIQAAQSVLGAA